MIARSKVLAAVMLPLGLLAVSDSRTPPQGATPHVTVTFPAARSGEPLDGRLLLLVSTDSSGEPRFQVSDGAETQLVFGLDVNGWRSGQAIEFPDSAPGYPLPTLADLPAGRYRVQTLLNRYETFHRADGHTVKLPPDRGEGQRWNLKPGNLYSEPRWADLGAAPVRLALTEEIPPIPPPPETAYIKHLRIRSELLTRFWGRPMELGAHVLLPEGFDEHPEARYPLVINHGHFPYDFGGFRETPPDSSVPCTFSARFQMECYNRIQQEHAYQFYRDWTGPDFPASWWWRSSIRPPTTTTRTR